MSSFGGNTNRITRMSPCHIGYLPMEPKTFLRILLPVPMGSERICFSFSAIIKNSLYMALRVLLHHLLHWPDLRWQRIRKRSADLLSRRGIELEASVFFPGALKDWQAIQATPTPPCLHMICPGVVANVALARFWLHKQTHSHDLRTVIHGAMSLNYRSIFHCLAVVSAWRCRHGHGASL